MRKIDFPIFKTKSPSRSPKFDLTDSKQRAAYFDFKAGVEIRKLKDYLKDNTFVALLLGKKGSGKGTYAKLFREIIGPNSSVHLSVGDLARAVDGEVADLRSRKKLVEFLNANYRGWLPVEKLIEAQLGRSTKKLLPTEFILALIKREINRLGRRAIFIDGFPRNLDQISYSLFFRDLIGFRDDPDFFILIDVPEKVIDERIRYRKVCPICQTTRNLKLLATKKVEYDTKTKQFYLVCDSPACKGARMVVKEGDEFGIGPIKERLELDEKLMEQALNLYGIPKILLRNSIPVNQAAESVDDYEITPEYVYHWDPKSKKVEIEKKSWVVDDDNGAPSYSLMPPPVAVSLIKQLADLI